MTKLSHADLELNLNTLRAIISDYRKAPGIENFDVFSLAYNWHDKPHRLLYDMSDLSSHLIDYIETGDSEKLQSFINNLHVKNNLHKIIAADEVK